MKMKVLVTGAVGFIGRYVVDELLKNGYGVIALAHKKHFCFDERVEVIQADIREEGVIEQISHQAGECSILVHLAADINMVGDDQTILTNCLGTYHLVRLADLISVKHFIYISSIPVIGAPKYLPITEEHPVSPKTLYHITKYMGEQIVTLARSDRMETTILRIPSPIGAGMSKKNYLSFLLKQCMSNGTIELYGEGKRIQNYIDVRDIAAAVVCSITARVSGVFLIAGQKEISNRDLAFLCKRITESSSEIIWGKREDPEEGNQWIISGEKALAAFRFSPQYGLEESVRWIVDSLKKE